MSNRYGYLAQGREVEVPGAAVATVNREMATLKHMLGDILKAIPCTFKRLEESRGRTTILSPADALMRAAIGDQDPTHGSLSHSA